MVLQIPGLGVILTIIVLLLTGLSGGQFRWAQCCRWLGVAARAHSRRAVDLFGREEFRRDRILGFGQGIQEGAARRVPAQGRLYSLAFQTSTEIGEIQARTGEDVICCFVPTTPNPTSGFIIIVPKRDTIELDMEVDEALKMIISLGVVVPTWSQGQDRRITLECLKNAWLLTEVPANRLYTPFTPYHSASFFGSSRGKSSMRSHYCGQVDESLIGEEIDVCGWVHRRRDHGGVIFIDLRDREGLLQIVFDPDRADIFAEAERIRGEYVLPVKGWFVSGPKARSTRTCDRPGRSAGARARVLNSSETPPFHHDEQANEELRLTYRYLDLRREEMLGNLRCVIT